MSAIGTIGINEPVYGVDATGTGNADQEIFSEPMADITSPIEDTMYAYDVSSASNYIQEPFGETVYAFDASGLGDYVQQPIEEAVYAYDSSGTGDFVEDETIEEPIYAYDASGSGDYAEGYFLEPMLGNTGEDRIFGVSDGYSYDARDNLDQGAGRVAKNDGPVAVAVHQLDSAHKEEEEEEEQSNHGEYHDRSLIATSKKPTSGKPTPRPTTGKPTLQIPSTTRPTTINPTPDENSNTHEPSATGNTTASTNQNLKLQAWKHGASAIWNWDCDFPHMGEYKQVNNVRGEQCDPLCRDDARCTHFTYNKGTCFLKERGAFRQDAKDLGQTGAVCGIKKLGVPSYSHTAWMSKLPDRSELKDLLIPGTHNSVAGPQSATGLHKCQQDSVRDQLYRGVRYFDLRLARCESQHYDSFAGDKSLCFWHGNDVIGGYLDLSLDKVAWEFYWFLQNNPREVIVAKINPEYGHQTSNFLQRVERYFEEHHEWWRNGGQA